MTKFQKWLVISGSHHQNSKSYKKGQKFVTNADIAKFNTLPHAPKYKLIGPATEAEILQFQAESGFTGVPEPKHSEETVKPVNQIEEESEDEEPEDEEDYEDDLEGEEVPEDSLEAMTVTELKSLAADEEIDLSGIHLKSAIVVKIREARQE